MICPVCGQPQDAPPLMYEVHLGTMTRFCTFGDTTKCFRCASEIGGLDAARPYVIYAPPEALLLREENDLRGRQYTRGDVESGKMRRDMDRLNELRQLHGARGR